MDEGNTPALLNLVMEEEEEEEELTGGGGGGELTRSNSAADSSMSAENSGDGLHPSVKRRPDNGSAWTDEMHNKFLDSLEASFVQQLHRSRGLLAWCKAQNRGGKDITQRVPGCVNKASGQFGNSRDDGWKKAVFEKDRPLSYNDAIEIPWIHCQGLAEGSGQNFVDKDCEDRSNLFSLAMRSKTAVGDA
ncbi:OLC1v1000112C1 [Oldenlandia corymbosa var. corymbosa]|uniref:OLC1v1000112C1 n=1 Tax=Oldenlandia corymbosa var. corymbosa TaxID=529605 RepID=A0AAV1D533_OLDCO|nr:OLC1v1000112C1 [Oldenlandia corymbosa var. corymbosa]